MTTATACQAWTTTADVPRLRALRWQHGLSQEALAAKAGLSTTTVARLEGQLDATCRGRTPAAALGVSPAAAQPASPP